MPDVPQLVVEVAFSTQPDTAVPDYEDLSSRVRSFEINRGRQRELDQVQAGVLRLKLNNSDRALDPSYTFSPYWPNVLPMRKIRISAVWSGVTYYLFTGYVERWPISWDAPRWESVELTAVDGFALLAQAQIDGSFPQELSGARIARVLSAAGWPSATPLPGDYWTLDASVLGTSTVLSYSIPASVVDPGVSLVAAATIDPGTTTALAHIQEIVAAERGNAFIDGQGRFIFQDRHARYGTTSIVTFTDGSTSSTRIPYLQDGLEPEFDIEQVANEVIVTASGGAPQTAVDGNSIGDFWRRTLSLDLPLVSNTEALDRAGHELALRSQPRLEFTRLKTSPQALTSTWPAVLARELSDRVTVEASPQSPDPITAETINRDVFIEAVATSGTPSAWEISYQLSPADGYGQLFTLDTAELGSAVSARLAY